MRLAAISLALTVTVAAAAAAAAAAACSDSPTSVANGVVRVTREGSGIRIDNLTDTPRAYAAYDPNFLALADLSLLALCNTTDVNCLRLPAHGSVLVPFSEVGGYGSGTTSIVVWTWRVVPSATPGQYEPLMDEGVTLKLK